MDLTKYRIKLWLDNPNIKEVRVDIEKWFTRTPLEEVDKQIKNWLSAFEPNRDKVVVLMGGSGVGKNWALNKLLETGKFSAFLSTTTREIREGEENGIDYNFKSKSDFILSLIKGEFATAFVLESDGKRNLYGFRANDLNEMNEGEIPIAIVHVSAMREFMTKFPNSEIHLMLPDLENIENFTVDRIKRREPNIAYEKLESRVKETILQVHKLADQYGKYNWIYSHENTIVHVINSDEAGIEMVERIKEQYLTEHRDEHNAEFEELK